MRSIIVAALAALLLNGCASTPQQRLVSAQNSCLAYGFAQGSPEFAQCMMYKDAQLQQQDDAYRARLRAVGQNLLASPAVTTCQTQTTGALGRPMATTTCR